MADDIKKTETEQVSWNLAQQIIMQIANLLQNASSRLMSGDISGCFYYYKEIKILIFADITDAEKTTLKDLENEFSKSSSYLNSDFLRTRLRPDLFKKIESKIKLNKDLAFSQVETYRETIISLLSKYGYHISKKESSNKMF